MGAFRENFSSKWVYPEKTFLQNGCIQRKFFFKMGVSREFFYKMGVSRKKFLQNGCIQKKIFLQNGCFQRKLYFKMGASTPFLFLSFKVSLNLHVIKVSLLMWFSLTKSDNIPVKVKFELWSKQKTLQISERIPFFFSFQNFFPIPERCAVLYRSPVGLRGEPVPVLIWVLLLPQAVPGVDVHEGPLGLLVGIGDPDGAQAHCTVRRKTMAFVSDSLPK